MELVLTSKAEKLIRLLETEGYRSLDQFLEARGIDAVAPGICRNKSCDYVIEVEGDQRAGWCDECEDNTVVSLLILADMI